MRSEHRYAVIRHRLAVLLIITGVVMEVGWLMLLAALVALVAALGALRS